MPQEKHRASALDRAMSAVMCAGDQDHALPPFCRQLSVTVGQQQREERDLSTPGQPDLWSAFAAANGTPQQRQRSKSEQVGYGLDPWDAAQLLQGTCGQCSQCCSGSAACIQQQQQQEQLERPIARSSWPSLLRLSSCFAGASSLLSDEQQQGCCSANSSMCSSQTGSMNIAPCSSPASQSSSATGCRGGFCNRSSGSSSSCYCAGTPCSMCTASSARSGCSSMSTSCALSFSLSSGYSGSTSLSAASGSCWSSSTTHQISSRPAPGGGIGEGITWIMTEYAGREVLAEYEFGQTLGCGTFGVTRLVTHRRTARPWACKTICKASIAASPAAVSDVQHEVAILQHLAGHAGIVQLQGVYEDERNIHLVMELCTGGDLLDYISRFERLSEAEAADIGRVMLTTLQHCHRNGVVHRDIKPENFLLGAPTLLMAPAGSAAAVLKVSDFGVSAFHTPGEHFAEIVGTPFYMAPEVLERCYGPAADVWSVGVVIYLMIAGCLPFNGNSDRQIIKAVMDSEPDFSGDVWQGVSQQGREFIQLMLIKDPRKRASIEQLLAHPWMAGRAGSVSGESCGQHASGSSSSSTSAAAGAAEAADAVTSTAAPVADCSSSSSASCPSSAVAAADSSSCNSGKQQCCSQQQQVQGSGQAPAAAGAPEVSAVAASPRLAVATGSKVSMR